MSKVTLEDVAEGCIDQINYLLLHDRRYEEKAEYQQRSAALCRAAQKVVDGTRQSVEMDGKPAFLCRYCRYAWLVDGIEVHDQFCEVGLFRAAEGEP